MVTVTTVSEVAGVVTVSVTVSSMTEVVAAAFSVMVVGSRQAQAEEYSSKLAQSVATGNRAEVVVEAGSVVEDASSDETLEDGAADVVLGVHFPRRFRVSPRFLAAARELVVAEVVVMVLTSVVEYSVAVSKTVSYEVEVSSSVV
jgi:hypothetical protein